MNLPQVCQLLLIIPHIHFLVRVRGKGTEFLVYLTIANPSVYYWKSQGMDHGVPSKVIILVLLRYEILPWNKVVSILSNHMCTCMSMDHLILPPSNDFHTTEKWCIVQWICLYSTYFFFTKKVYVAKSSHESS